MPSILQGIPKQNSQYISNNNDFLKEIAWGFHFVLLIICIIFVCQRTSDMISGIYVPNNCPVEKSSY